MTHTLEGMKAEELIRKFMPHMYCYMGSGMLSNEYDVKVATDNAKECAIIHCKELFFIYEQMPVETGKNLSDFYVKVVNEISKITSLSTPKQYSMQKKLMYQLSDNADVSMVVMDLSGCIAWIEADMESAVEGEDEREFTLTPIWLTDEEYNNLPEANF